MRNAIVGMVIGLVIGVVIGATVIAPSLPDVPAKTDDNFEAAERKQEPTWKQPIPKPVVEIQKTWRYTGEYAAGVPLLGELAQRLGQKVDAASGGDTLVPYRDPGSLMPRDEVPGALAAGTLDAAFVSPNAFNKSVPALSVLAGIPFGPPPRELMAWLSKDETKALVSSLFKKAGVHGIPCGILPPQGGGWFTKKIGGLEDLAGLRIALEGLPAEVAEAVGMRPSANRGGQIFTDLEAGRLDGAFLHTPAIDAHLGIQKLAPFAYFPGWHRPSGIMVLAISLNKWKGAKEQTKTIFETACGDNIRYSYAASEAAQFEALKRLQQEGVTIRRWPGRILEAFRESWRNLAANRSEKDEEFAQALQSLTQFRKQYAVWNELSR